MGVGTGLEADPAACTNIGTGIGIGTGTGTGTDGEADADAGTDTEVCDGTDGGEPSSGILAST